MAHFGPAGLPKPISRRVESEIIKAALSRDDRLPGREKLSWVNLTGKLNRFGSHRVNRITMPASGP